MREQDDTSVAPEPGRRHAEIVDIGQIRGRRHSSLLSQARRLMLECRDEEALAACREALRLVPDSEEALALASTLAAVRGASREALHFALQMVQLEPAEADGYYEVAMSLLDLGHPEEALAWLDMGSRLAKDRMDDLPDFFAAAQAEALGVLFRFEEAEATLRAARDAGGDELGVLRDAREKLIWLRSRPGC